MRLTRGQIDAIDALFAPWDRPDTPGAAVLVLQRGEVLHERGFGMAHLEHGLPITPDSVFHIASMSKQFTAACVALLALEGRVDLDADVHRHIPELPDYGRAITLRQMLHHTSGLRDQWALFGLAGRRPGDLITADDVLELVCRQRELNFAPGTQFEYSNSGYGLIDHVVARATGQTLRELADERLFAPLAMRSTLFHDDRGAPVPRRAQAYERRFDGRDGLEISEPAFETVGAGGMVSTVRDLARWALALQGWLVEGRDLVSLLLQPGRLEDGTRLRYAMGLSRSARLGWEAIEHGGQDFGWVCHGIQVLDPQLVVLVLGNAGTALAPGERADAIVRICLEAPAPPPLPAGGRPSAAELEALAGVYRNVRTGELSRYSVAGDALVSGLREPSPMKALSPRHFRPTELFPAWLTTFDDGGRARYGDWHDPGSDETELLERVAPVSPGAAAVAVCAGTFHSPDVRASLTVASEGGELVVHRDGHAPEALVPVDGLTFAASWGTLAFERGAVRIGVSRARSVRFDRV